MNTMIKQSVKPQTSRMTFYLLALVILGFGAFAEHYAKNSSEMAHQSAQSTSIDR